MKTEPTQGDWVFVPDPKDGWKICTTDKDGGWVLATLLVYEYDPQIPVNDPQQFANGRLMAASKKLLEACRRAVCDCPSCNGNGTSTGRYDRGGDDVGGYVCPRCQPYREAIHEAIGE